MKNMLVLVLIIFVYLNLFATFFCFRNSTLPDYKRLIPVKDYDNDTAIALFSAPIKINPDYIARISNVYSLFTKCSEIQGFEFYGVRAPISWKAKNDDFTCLVLIMPINT